MKAAPLSRNSRRAVLAVTAAGIALSVRTKGIPKATFDRLIDARAASEKGKASQVHDPDMSHAFHADYRPSYRKEAEEDGWKRMLVKDGVV